MKTSHYLLLLSVGLLTNLSADTIVLKSGTKYQGKVISEDDKSYLIEVRVTKTIKDERRIPKGDVREIIKDAKDAGDYDRVKALVPTPDRLSAEGYSQRLNIAQNFLTKFPKSKHRKEVKAIVQTLENEQKSIAAGGIKLSGQLISASDVEANAYDIHARMLYLDMKNLAANGQSQQALRKWESLQTNFAHSEAAQDSIKIVGRILTAYAKQLKTALDTLEARKQKRSSVLESLADNDRERTVKLLAEKQRAYAALIEKETKEMRTKWLTIDLYHREALEHNLRSAEATLNSIRSGHSPTRGLAGPHFRGAWSAMAKGNLEDATMHINKLKAMQLPEKYTAPLARQLTEKQAEQAAEKKAAAAQAEQERLDAIQAEKEAKEADSKKKPGQKSKQDKETSK